MPGPYAFPTNIKPGDSGHVAWGNGVGAALNDADPAATPFVLVERDAAGRAKFADPAVAQDAMTKGYADAAYVGRGRAICKGFTRADVIACLDAAEAIGKHSIADFPAGQYDVGPGISLAGRSCLIHGAGAGGSDLVGGRGTTFHASTQAGPVLDFTGWVIPVDGAGQAFTAKVSHGGFTVKGSGVADATKANSGVRLKVMSSVAFQDISVRDTGGPAWEHVSSPGNGVYLCDFERIVLNTPVGATANDVPYMVMDESNGNHFSRIGFRAVTGTNDTGVSGALVIKGNATYTGYDNTFDAIWFEWLHAQNGGCLINATVNTSRFQQIGWHDCGKETGAVGTAYIRFNKPAVQDYGGNIIDGVIPGNGGTANEIDTGVDLRQSGNRVVGVRGYNASCATIAAGVNRSFIQLGGTTSTPAGAAVVDNSGTTTNIIVDSTGGAHTINRTVINNLTVRDAVTPANGTAAVGNITLQATGTLAILYAALLQLRDSAGTGAGAIQFGTGPGVYTGSGSPETVVTASPGSIYLNTAGGAGASLWVKESGVAATGWIAK